MRPLDWFPGIYQTQHTHASISPDGRRSNTWLTSNWAANSIARVERPLLPGEFALLAMLLDGPMHGYEMARAFEAPELQLICPIEQSSLYTYLRNLEARGFVEWHERRVGARPPRKMFELTPCGREHVERWLRDSVHRMREVRLDFLLKLFFLRRRDQAAAARLVEDQLRACEEYLRTVEATEPVSDFHEVVLTSRRSAAIATLDWLRTYSRQLATESG